MARAIWKGSISFGLVNIPVSLYAAEQRSDIQFRMIDSRNYSRIRYERVNEATGEEVPWDAVVKGYEYDGDQYILLSKEDMEAVSPEATKTIDIEDFIDLESIDFLFFDKPYYLEAGKTGEKSYLLLAQALEKTGKAGVARVVIRSRQHLCAILTRKGRLLINLLRFPQELRDIEDFKAPDAEAKRNQLSKREIDMATQLIDSMTVEWDPERYRDEYREKLMDWINEKISSGELESAPDAPSPKKEGKPGKVVDLVDYLKQSVEERKGGGKRAKKSSKKAARKKKSKKAAKKAAKKSRAKKVAKKAG